MCKIHPFGVPAMVILALAAHSTRTFSSPIYIDLGEEVSEFDGFKIEGAAAGDLVGYTLRGAGDVNGDGYEDFMVAAPGASPDERGASGIVYLIYGGPHLRNRTTPLSLSELKPEEGLAIWGEFAGDGFGSEVSGGFDFNGNGYDDILIGAFSAHRTIGLGLGPRGACYILWGGPDGVGTGGIYDTRDIEPSKGHRIRAARNEGVLGIAVSGVGDINHDGLIDVMFGAGFAPNNENIHEAGEHYILFGTEKPFPLTNYPLDQLHLDLNDDGQSDGLTIRGIGKQDYVGFRLAGVGDVDGDGIDDFMTTTWNWNSTLGEWDPVVQVVKQTLDGYGALYVFFGKKGGWGTPPALELDELSGSDGVWIPGLGQNHQLGIYSAGVGDFNGDGLNDILGGGRFASPNGHFEAGIAYLLYGGGIGGEHLPTLDLHQLDPNPPTVGSSSSHPHGISLEGTIPGGNVGTRVDTAGDINGDGYADFFVGAPGNRIGEGDIARGGAAYLFLGREEPIATSASVNITDVADYVFHRTIKDQWTGLSASGVGDLDGDGFGDFLIGSPGGANSQGETSGVAWLCFGKPTSAKKSATYRTYLAADSLLEKPVGSNRGGTHSYPFSRLLIAPGVELSAPELISVTVTRSASPIVPVSETAAVHWLIESPNAANGAKLRVQYQPREVAHLMGNLRLAWSSGEYGLYTLLQTDHDPNRRLLAATIPQEGYLLILGDPNPVLARLLGDVPPVGPVPDQNADGILDAADLIK